MNRENLDSLLRQKNENLKMGGESGVEKQHKLGKLTARERIAILADEGTFFEFGLLADHTPMNVELANKSTPADGVVTGTCLVGGRPAALAAYDFTVVAGSMGEVGERKVERMRKLALQERIPMIWLLDSAGARIQEIAGAHFAGTGGLFFQQVELSGVVPQVAAVMGPTAAGTSYIAALADYTPMVKGIGSMALAGPPLVKAAIGEEVTTEDLGGSKVHCEISGCGDGEFADDAACLAAVKKFLGFLPSNCDDKPPYEHNIEGLKLTIDDRILEILPENPKQAYDMREIVKLISDDEDFFEIKPAFAQNIIVGFARVMGYSIGIVANQPLVKGGALDNDAADKAARFLMMCNAYQVPVLFLHDCPGFMVGSQVERAGIIRHGAKMLHVVASLSVPKISIVVRKSYGAGYYVMCGKGMNPDLIVGWPSSEISLMGAEGAVNIVMKNRDDDKSRETKIEEYRKNIGGLLSAQMAHIDDIIDPRESRQAIYRALQFSYGKSSPRAYRRNGIIPV